MREGASVPPEIRWAAACAGADRWSRTAGASSSATSIRSSTGAASAGAATASIIITATRMPISFDLRPVRAQCPAKGARRNRVVVTFLPDEALLYSRPVFQRRRDLHPTAARKRKEAHRSEEHTSELQSHHDLVCRLLLEKKKE